MNLPLWLGRLTAPWSPLVAISMFTPCTHTPHRQGESGFKRATQGLVTAILHPQGHPHIFRIKETCCVKAGTDTAPLLNVRVIHWTALEHLLHVRPHTRHQEYREDYDSVPALKKLLAQRERWIRTCTKKDNTERNAKFWGNPGDSVSLLWESGKDIRKGARVNLDLGGQELAGQRKEGRHSR